MPKSEHMPTMPVGKFKGVRIDRLPNAYLRWVVKQNFSAAICKAAKKKLGSSEFYNEPINVTRHALDMYSKRFIDKWLETDWHTNEAPGLATFIAIKAKEAWLQGKDVSRHRHQEDAVVKEFLGVQWVFGVDPHHPEYLDVITVMKVE